MELLQVKQTCTIAKPRDCDKYRARKIECKRANVSKSWLLFYSVTYYAFSVNQKNISNFPSIKQKRYYKIINVAI
jgi:hypothetical protein